MVQEDKIWILQLKKILKPYCLHKSTSQTCVPKKNNLLLLFIIYESKIELAKNLFPKGCLPYQRSL